MPTEEQVFERMPTWEALSEFFLDDNLSHEDYQRIASALARSRYTEDELLGMLRHEVYPTCSLNLVCVAGAWGAWGEEWIRERIAPRYNRRPRFHLPAFNWDGIHVHWNAVKNLMIESRSKQQQGEQNGCRRPAFCRCLILDVRRLHTRMKTSSFTTLLIRVAAVFVFVLVGLVFWLRWVPYDKQWRKPAHLIESFLGPAQKKDYTQAGTFFSSHQLKNIAAWEGSFEVWCDQFAGYSKFEVGPTGPGKAGHYWTDVFGVTPDGRREFVERIYAQRFDGVWSLEYGLSYEAWLALH